MASPAGPAVAAPDPPRFTNGEPAPAIEAGLRAALEKAFPPRPGEPAPYSIECRDMTCKLDLDPGQDARAYRVVLEKSLQGTMKTVTGTSDGIYFDLMSPDDIAIDRYVASVFAVIRGSPETAACKQQFPAPGDVVIHLALDSARRVQVTMTGKLADADFGQCLRPIAEAAPSHVPPLPSNIRSLGFDVSTVIAIAAPDSSPQQRRKPLERTLTAQTMQSD